jgi:hypothetical protein
MAVPRLVDKEPEAAQYIADYLADKFDLDADEAKRFAVEAAIRKAYYWLAYNQDSKDMEGTLREKKPISEAVAKYKKWCADSGRNTHWRPYEDRTFSGN